MTTWLRHLIIAMGILALSPGAALAQANDETGAPAAPSDTAPADAPATDGTPEEPATQTDAPASGEDLPEVEVIQEQPQPPPPEPTPEPVTTPAPEPAFEPDLAEAPIELPPQTTLQARAAGNVAPTSPFPGSEIAIEKVPGGVSTVSATDLQRVNDAKPQEALQKYVPGVIINDTAGSSYRTQIEYRGFSSGPITGFPQGLAVYQNGVRINEVFGDVVYWDVLPSNAINDITIVSGNPAFGLNSIGGAVTVQMKDGFDFQGAEIDALAGSFNRRQVGVQLGANSGPWAAYFAGEIIDDDQFRDFSDVEIRRGYADLAAKGSMVEAHLNFTFADNIVGQVAASPVELLDIGWNRTFTSPQTTDIEVYMPSLNLSAKVTDTTTVSGLAYYRRFKSDVVDGNLLDAEPCSAANTFDPAGPFLCDEEDGEILEDITGTQINFVTLGLDDPFGVIDNINQVAKSYGGGLQLVEKAKLFGLGNQFTVGVSYDRGNVSYQTAAELGEIGNKFVVDGSGVIIGEPEDFTGRNVDVDTNYFGLYFSNTLDLTDQFALTVGGRYNYARIDLVDLTGEFEGITSKHKFVRFNPMVGGTYELIPGLTLYGSYAENNRAPTPAELACANPEEACPIESFLTDDPPLQQVISNTYEVGLRGKTENFNNSQSFGWGLGLFRTLNEDDLIFITSATSQGRGFFQNIGDTLRQGVEAYLNYQTGPWSFYANYSYVRATYESSFQISSPAHPFAILCDGAMVGDDPACINVRSGDFIPGIPEHRFKTGFDYWITPKWKFGMDMVSASGQFLLTDDANLLRKLAGYARFDLHSSYDITDNIQVYGFVNNVFDARYGLFGNLFGEEAFEVAEELGFDFSNPRGLTPAPPVSAYGGIKVKF